MGKIGRNDKCPCGSGKKYKKCCGELGKTEKTLPPGHISVAAHQRLPDGYRLNVNLYGKRSEFYDKQIEEMCAAYINHYRPRGKEIEVSIRDCKHKLYGVLWHRDAFIDTVLRECESISKKGPSVICVSYEEEHPAIVYLFEGFLFQVKSCVEMLEDFVIRFFALDDVLRQELKDDDKGKKSWDALKSALNQKGAGMVVETVEKYAGRWLGQLTKMRDEVAHKSRLKDFRCIVQDTPQIGLPTTIVKPKIPNGDDAIEYCGNIWKQLIKLHDEVFKAVGKI